MFSVGILAELLQQSIAGRARSAGKIIHGKIQTFGFSFDTFLQNKLVEFYSRCGSLEEASRVFAAIPSKNIYSWNNAISAFCKGGNLPLACDLLREMPERDVVSWNTLIGALIRAGERDKGLDVCRIMLREGFVPTCFTLAGALSASGSLNLLILGRAWHGLAVRIGLEIDGIVENALVGMYCKCGGSSEGMKIFDGIRQPNEVAFTAMMGGLLKDGSMKEALLLFSKMRKKGISVDCVAISTVLAACAVDRTDVLGEQIHAIVVKSSFDSDTHVDNSLIDFYAKSGEMGSAEKAFSAHPKRNNVSWNALIGGYGNQGECDKARDALEKMLAVGFKPDDITYVALLSVFAKAGDMTAARQAFDKMFSPSLTSWNTVLSGYSEQLMHQETLELFRLMQFSGIPFDRTTVAVALSACSGAGHLYFGKQIHASSLRRLLDRDLFVGSGLVDVYCKCGAIDLARVMFDRMPERDVVSWNSMLAGLALQSNSMEAFRLFRKMQETGLRPTKFSYPTVISSCARLSSLIPGIQLHGQSVKDGLVGDVFVGSSLIGMYAKCGAIGDARRLFDQAPSRNVVSWNEMILGYAENGRGRAAVKLFEQMLLQGEARPDEITLVGVLTGCSHAGLADKAVQLLDAMEGGLRLAPEGDHYACVVDALGRAGRFDEIRALLGRIPARAANPVIWEVLLSACRIHGEMELGSYAAERLFRVDPLNPTPYVLLSNMYATCGQWDRVSALRRAMVDRGIVKNRAYSWINDDDSVRVVMVYDTTEEDFRVRGDQKSTTMEQKSTVDGSKLAENS
ncbi:pentatricopeptide repeat-containing protein At4g20770-like [Wolffia australiana]